MQVAAVGVGISRALRLNDDERAYLGELARLRTGSRPRATVSAPR